ncbi:hypothetical protein [Streptomyces sp. MAR4 CNX-425]|uniref:hypothetical protein n=1 Tax=Streptomyces sp. MAR4 CNX-425 TaxID=3406343 RepID=UPI003B50729C
MAETTGPGEPEGPAEPEGLDTPGDSAAPKAPAESAAPKESAGPPAGSAKSAAPGKRTRPAQPAKPGNPTAPADPAEAAGAGRADPVAGARGRWRVGGVAVLVLLVLAGAGLLVQAARLNGDDALANRALTDAAGTAAVAGDVSNALSKVFSYAPEDPGVTARDADELLAGRAREQYRQLFGRIQQRVVSQELTLTTHVVRAGVIRLDGDDASLLVLLDQVTERKGEDPTSVGAQLSVTAERQDGRWRITDLKSR